jgi:hypothetical protein
MPPLHTILRGGKRSGAKHVPVTLAARSTEIGTLELWCVGKESDNRWRLEFNVRDIVVDDEGETDASTSSAGAAVDVWPEAQVQAARAVFKRFYSDETPDAAVKEIYRELEAALEAPRHEWPTGLCRRLWEFLLEIADQRRRSAPHLARWYHLVGFCLRPGFGDSLDRFRVEQLWKLLASQALGGATPAQARIVDGGADYWIMWRRVSGGLHNALQQALYDRLRPVLVPGKGKSMPKPGSNELAEMWRAAASLERLEARHKQTLGEALLKSMRRSPASTYAFWSLTRLGARRLLYGPLNTIVHPEIVTPWIESLISFEPGHPAEVTGWGFCLAQLARRTGQRALDVDEALSQRVAERLREAPLPPAWIRMVEEVVERQAEEQSQVFGESLPIGLRLSAPAD